MAIFFILYYWIKLFITYSHQEQMNWMLWKTLLYYLIIRITGNLLDDYSMLLPVIKFISTNEILLDVFGKLHDILNY